MTGESGSGTTGQPGAGGAGGEGGTGEWYAGIADEGLRGYVQTKGFKDPAALADSYRNLEKLVGVPQDRLLKLPEKPDDPAWADVHARLGRPETPDGYELKFEGDDAFAKRMAARMHALGIPKSAAAGLNEEWNAYVAEIIQQDEQARQQKDAAEMTELKGKWGAKFDENAELARRAGREFGLSEDEFKAISASLGSGKTLELFQRIGGKLGEAAPFNPQGGNGGGGFGLTAEGARARIQTLMGDKDWTARYLNGGAAEKDEMTRLQKIAAGEA
jgi:hypothetical protein